MSFSHLEDLGIGPGDALFVADVQNDFLSGGSLAVPGGDEIIPVLNRAIRRFEGAQLPVFAGRDWHPPDHCSFRERGGPWPTHCVQGTWGARFSAALTLPPSAVVISKASRRDKEAYSAFEGTDLEERLRAASVRHLFIGGLATDYCILNTVRDALDHGFAVSLLSDAIRAIDARDGERAVEEMLRRGAVAIEAGPYRPPAAPAPP